MRIVARRTNAATVLRSVRSRGSSEHRAPGLSRDSAHLNQVSEHAPLRGQERDFAGRDTSAALKKQDTTSAETSSQIDESAKIRMLGGGSVIR
jgi:hypothetical protein